MSTKKKINNEQGTAKKMRVDKATYRREVEAEKKSVVPGKIKESLPTPLPVVAHDAQKYVCSVSSFFSQPRFFIPDRHCYETSIFNSFS